MVGACLVILDEHRLMIMGGGRTSGTWGHDATSTNVYIYDARTGNDWEAKASMQRARNGFACGKVVTASGDIEVVAAGGRGNLQGVEYYSVKDNRWRWTTGLPQPVEGPSVLPYTPDSFLVIGGLSQNPGAPLNESRDILIWNHTTKTWTKLADIMDILMASMHTAPMWVDANKMPNCGLPKKSKEEEVCVPIE